MLFKVKACHNKAEVCMHVILRIHAAGKKKNKKLDFWGGKEISFVKGLAN